MSSILVSCRNKASAVHYYIPALKAAGWHGAIHLVAPGEVLPSLEGVAGLVITGGGDIHPRHWDSAEPLHPKAQVDSDRDELEIPLIRTAWEQGLPIFGICRGQQILNVALGGSLIQDVPEATGCDPHLHEHGTHDEPDLRHRVAVTHDSRLAQLLGSTTIHVNSRHHQAVKQVASALKAVAFHPETLYQGTALVEGIEATDPNRWAVGVQWHPENLVELPNAAGAAARKLFEGFVKAVTLHATVAVR